jgi:uncharacterized protein (TIGR02118 family)
MDYQEVSVVKLTVLYNRPTDPDAFEKYYLETHVPEFGAKLPGLLKADLCKALETGTPAPYYRTADLWFKDGPGLQMALGSQEGKAAIADLQNFASGGFQVLMTEVNTVEVAAASV